eukprot:1147623-Pelagomonas_calceolata.AAC.3
MRVHACAPWKHPVTVQGCKVAGVQGYRVTRGQGNRVTRLTKTERDIRTGILEETIIAESGSFQDEVCKQRQGNLLVIYVVCAGCWNSWEMHVCSAGNCSRFFLLGWNMDARPVSSLPA